MLNGLFGVINEVCSHEQTLMSQINFESEDKRKINGIS